MWVSLTGTDSYNVLACFFLSLFLFPSRVLVPMSSSTRGTITSGNLNHSLCQ